GSLQVPPTQACPSGQLTPTHFGSTHSPSGLQVSCGGHGNSPELHLGQTPSSSISPSQSSSRELHTSLPGWTFWMHSSFPFLHCSVPSEQMPGWPVSQGAPPPEHWMPSTRIKRSSKSLSPPLNRSSHPK